MDDWQTCPRCKTTKYRNPKLKLLVNVCGHKLCETCVETLFTRPSAACPECNTALRRNDFRIQQFEDLIVEKEVDIRKRILKIYNKLEDDFQTASDPLRAYNDYLEEVESIIWNLANGQDVEETKKQIDKYKKDNESLIRKNNFKLGREEAMITSQIEEDERLAEQRRMEALLLEKQEKNDKKKENEQFLDRLTRGELPLQDIVAEHASKLQKKSLLFSGRSTQGSSLQKETVAPLPSTEGSKFVYVAPQVENNGPTAPDMEVLASRGYLRHIRSATRAEKAGGFSSELACGRAIQEAFAGLYLGIES
ncbi:CDK-activating kinase assembly factor MAT1-like [Acropora muricata]|uniref:CDK-activating kinase assembly factor MAT1-like n=1 Tax=Acropora millepora TaxID=45264 RepID=UPI001CF39C45|nr:CDK-activating kinase assembly factor MAT1-like [Acropora millepora]